jgi:hypothetical protein
MTRLSSAPGSRLAALVLVLVALQPRGGAGRGSRSSNFQLNLSRF